MVDMVTRAQWDARPPRSTPGTASWSQRTGYVVHYSGASATQTVRSIQNYHMDVKGWIDIGYNRLVTVDGRAWEGRAGGWSAIGAHAGNHNTETVGVCMIGTNADVTDAAKVTIRALYDEACGLAGKKLAMQYHSQLNETTCPGDNLRAWVQAGMPAPTGGGDMPTEAQFQADFYRLYDFLQLHPAVTDSVVLGEELPVVPLLTSLRSDVTAIKTALDALTVMVTEAAYAGAHDGAENVAAEAAADAVIAGLRAGADAVESGDDDPAG